MNDSVKTLPVLGFDGKSSTAGELKYDWNCPTMLALRPDGA
ncbi:MAG: hypothetical protein VB859_02400 [Planctomycetaceae bacterium]